MYWASTLVWLKVVDKPLFILIYSSFSLLTSPVSFLTSDDAEKTNGTASTVEVMPST